MITYISVILIGAIVIITGNYFFAMERLGFSLGFNIFGVVLSIVVIIALDGLIASTCHRLQHKWLTPPPKSSFFSVSLRQKRVLEFFGVKRFKDFLPDLGTIVKFPKRKIANPRSKDYIALFILETCSGELTHILSMFLGYLIIFIFKLRYFLCFGVPVATVNLVLHLLPAMALRYNRYKLITIYETLDRKEKATH